MRAGLLTICLLMAVLQHVESNANHCRNRARGYCDYTSGDMCGHRCRIYTPDCGGGKCLEKKVNCTKSEPKFCSSISSTHCGESCESNSECGDAGICGERVACPVIATYLGAIPSGKHAPPLLDIPDVVNFVLLGFAKDVNNDGNFVPFSEWGREGVTKSTILGDKATHPNRKYIVSLGGAAGWGGTFGIRAGMSVEEWVTNADNSIVKIVNDLALDGVDVQFEGGTATETFSKAIPKLVEKLKSHDYIVSYGPYYSEWNVWHDYVKLPLDNVDYVFCQFYAYDWTTVEEVQSGITAAASDLGGWSKLVAGFNSLNRKPVPAIALQAVYNLRGNLKGTFTWAAGHSKSIKPPYCIEINSAKILVNGEVSVDCLW